MRPLPKLNVISMGSSRPVPRLEGSEYAVESTFMFLPGPRSLL